MAERPGKKRHRTTQALAVVGTGALLFYASKFLLNFFGPAIGYSMRENAMK